MNLTLGQFIDNMEKNGYPQIRHSMFGINDNGELDINSGGCALGQACYNTFKEYEIPSGFWNPIYATTSPSTGRSFDTYIVDLNDDEGLDIPTIVKMAREEFADQLDTVIF